MAAGALVLSSLKTFVFKAFIFEIMKQKIAFAMIMGVITTCIISFTLVAVNVGFNERFVTVWLRSWAIAYAAVIPAILIIGPQIQKLVDYLFPQQLQK
jgi:hypothetical protein